MVPMHWSDESTDGMAFTISFGIGAMLITALLWILRYFYAVCRTASCTSALQNMPSFHWSKMAIPGAVSGTLWSLGNILSMVSVQNLGQGVGFSVIQAAMLVGGLWGIFCFREIEGSSRICRWFLSATWALLGILLLSYEHHAAGLIEHEEGWMDISNNLSGE